MYTTLLEELPALACCLLAGFVSFNGSKYVKTLLSRTKPDEYAPIGVIKSLFIFPLKSARGHNVFSFFCGPRGPLKGEIQDREFQLVNGETGDVYTCKVKPQIVLVEANIEHGILRVKVPGEKEIFVDKDEVKKRNKICKTLWTGVRIDAYDCGEEASKIFSKFLQEDNVCLVMMDESLYNERICVSSQDFWKNNPVPERIDKVRFHNFAPYLIQTEASLADLNQKMAMSVEQRQLRPVIVIDKCPGYDEDKWAELKIGDVELQCYRPCGRCPLITVNPYEGVKHNDLQPLKTLRGYRMAPKGVMLDFFKEKPIFGVCAGIYKDKTGYIHEGQTVYARYKPSEW